uniref:CRAL-TRIO domain-containing protein n=1 Tax=Piliocolobus tephrosceles TaxID=591936 RepID=A0A8C9LYN3_9PRIM
MAGQDLSLSTSHPFYDVARHGILQVAGRAPAGQSTGLWVGWPSFRYLKYTLDQYVENDYTIVYFHYGLNSRNKPSLGWLQSAYKEFDRKDGLGQAPCLMPVIPALWETKIQEELEGPLRGAPHQLHQGPVEHLQAAHQSQVWEKSHLFQLPEPAP